MIIFSTPTTLSLAQQLSLQHGACTFKKFSDGELFVRIDEDVRNKEVFVLAATQPPAEHWLELIFLLDALQRSGAIINIFITYFGYARQVKAEPGEALSAGVMSKILGNFSIKNIYILHPHSLLLEQFLSFKPVYYLEFFCEHATYYDAIAAPDKGALAFAQEVANRCNKELISLTKQRPEHEQVTVSLPTTTKQYNKVLLVDDMISTGRTMVAAATALQQVGIKTIAAAAMHGVFSPTAQEFLEQSILEKIFVTNTIAQTSHGKIHVVDIAPFVYRYITNQ